MYVCLIIIYKRIYKYTCVWQTEEPTFKIEGNNENLGEIFKSYIFLYQGWTTNLGVFFNIYLILSLFFMLL